MRPLVSRTFLSLFAFLLLTAEAPSPWGVDEMVGRKAEEFTLKDPQGATVPLSSFRGRVVLLNFWATWCPPCREEMPSLNRLHRKFRDQGFVVVAVATDRRSSDVKEYLAKHPVDFQVLIDTEMKTSRLYKVFSLPTSFLIDRNGVILKRYLGEEEWDAPDITAEVRKALSGRQ